MQYRNTMSPAGGQSCPAHFDNRSTRSADNPQDGRALLALARDAVDARLIPESSRLTQTLETHRALGLPDKMQDALAEALAKGPAADRALSEITPLFRQDDVVQIKAIDPAGGGALSRCGDLSVPEQRNALRDFINEHIGRRNLYFGINPRRTELGGTNQDAKASDVMARRAMFVDMDLKDAPDVDPDWTQTRVELEALNPTLLVETGNGFHAHFAVEETTGGALPASVDPLADAMAALGSDNVADLPRIARLPWTVNLPNASKRARGAVPTLARAVDLPNSPSAPRPVAALCEALQGVAARLSLPGRGANRASASDRTGDKTGWAAPSVDLLRMAMQEMPNDGPFDGRADWMDLAHAVKGAAMAGDIEPEGREIWLEWCARWSEGCDIADNEKAWDGINNPHTGWGTVKRLLERHNPTGARRVADAGAQAAFPRLPEHTGLQPAQPFAASALPPRRWLYGRAYYAGYLSMLVAPGGTGKSALTMAEAVAMATGKTLLPGDTPHHALRVLYHNAEDDLDEQRRRLEAALRHHGVSHADLGKRLFLTSGRDLPLTLARQGRDGVAVNREAVEWLVTGLISKGIEVLILDPLGAMHELPENSNEAANVLMGALREIAERSGAAIGLIHHTGKMAARDMEAAGAGAARGASAFVDGARFVRQLRRAGTKDVNLGIPPADLWQYVRVDNGKANLAPAGAAHWLRLSSVPLNNGTTDYPDGDHVQTVESWTPTGTSTIDTPANVWTAFQALAGADVAERRLDVKSPGWVGFIFANALGLDIGPSNAKTAELDADQTLNRNAVRGLIAAGEKDGWIIRAEEYVPDNKRKSPVFDAGKEPPEPTDEPAPDVEAT